MYGAGFKVDRGLGVLIVLSLGTRSPGGGGGGLLRHGWDFGRLVQPSPGAALAPSGTAF